MKRFILFTLLIFSVSTSFGLDLSSSRIKAELNTLEACEDDACRVWSASFVIAEQEYTLAQYLKALSGSKNLSVLQSAQQVGISVEKAAIEHREAVHALRNMKPVSNKSIYNEQQKYMLALMDTLTAVIQTYRSLNE